MSEPREKINAQVVVRVGMDQYKRLQHLANLTRLHQSLYLRDALALLQKAEARGGLLPQVRAYEGEQAPVHFLVEPSKLLQFRATAARTRLRQCVLFRDALGALLALEEHKLSPEWAAREEKVRELSALVEVPAAHGGRSESGAGAPRDGGCRGQSGRWSRD